MGGDGLTTGNTALVENKGQDNLKVPVKTVYKETSTPKKTSFIHLTDGTLAEQIWNPETKFSGFVLRQPDGIITEQVSVWDDGTQYVPALPSLVKKGVILLPSKPFPYDSEARLLEEIRKFIDRYVDVTEEYGYLAAGYVLLTWVYDAFDALPYLRALGDYGTGKTRFLQVIGSVCYKPMFSSGAATVSPLFRIVDTFRGTLVLDEADFGRTDMSADLIKILNQGYMRGQTVLRSEKVGDSYEPTAFDVYGPKILATRKRFGDKALESRCLTHVMETTGRNDLPLALGARFFEEALQLRNCLVSYRLERLLNLNIQDAYAVEGLEPRLAQVISPLRTILHDDRAIAILKDFARSYQEEIRQDRSQSDEGDILRVLIEIHDHKPKVSVGDIAETINGRSQTHVITPKAVGQIVRELGLKTKQSGGKYYVVWDEGRIDKLRTQYEVPKDVDL